MRVVKKPLAFFQLSNLIKHLGLALIIPWFQVRVLAGPPSFSKG
jgi:hypothetical protein